MSQEILLRRNIFLLRLLKIDPWILIAAIVVAYQMHVVGLTLSQVLIGEAIFAATIVLFEIPSGVFSDVFSRRTTMIFGMLFLLFAYIFFAFARSFGDIIAAQIAAGLGIATISGTDSALLYDTLLALGREKDHKKILSSFTSFRLVVIAAGTVTGGLLAGIDLRLPVLLGIFLPCITLGITFALTEPLREKSESHSHLVRHTKEAWRWLLTQKTLLIFLLGNMAILLGFKIANHTFNPYMELLGVPVLYWGFILSGFMLGEAAIAHTAHRWMERIGERASFLALFALQAVGFLLMAAAAPIALAFLFPIFIYMSWPLRDIFISDAVNKRTPSGRRATILSMASFAAQGLQAVALPLLGFAVMTAGLSALYWIMATTALATGMFLVLFLQMRSQNDT